MWNREDRGDPRASQLYKVYGSLTSEYRAPRSILLSGRD